MKIGQNVLLDQWRQKSTDVLYNVHEGRPNKTQTFDVH